MRRAISSILLLIVILATTLAGCSRAAPQPAEPKKGQEAPAPREQAPAARPPARETAAKPGSYFPLVKGTIWEYQGSGNEFASFTREVIFTGGSRAQVREDNGGTVMAVIFEASDDAVTRVFSQGETYDRVNLLDRPATEKTVILKAPLQVGTKWKNTGGDREITDTAAVLNTPAGKFENCIKVRISGQDSTVYEYFKEGVGMVKREFISGEAKISSTLKKYTPGAK